MPGIDGVPYRMEEASDLQKLRQQVAKLPQKGALSAVIVSIFVVCDYDDTDMNM